MLLPAKLLQESKKKKSANPNAGRKSRGVIIILEFFFLGKENESKKKKEKGVAKRLECFKKKKTCWHVFDNLTARCKHVRNNKSDCTYVNEQPH